MKNFIDDFIVPKYLIVGPLPGKLTAPFRGFPKNLIVSGKEMVATPPRLSYFPLKRGDCASFCIGRRRRNCGSISVDCIVSTSASKSGWLDKVISP